MLPGLDAVSGVGVKVAVRVSPEPEMAPKMPPTSTMSPVVPSQANVLPGSSENVKVMVAVWPVFSTLRSEVMLRLGGVVSTL